MNIAPTLSQFNAAYPEFASVNQTQAQNQLDESISLLNLSIWGNLYSNAVMLDVAHNLLLMTLAAQNSGQGALQVAAGPVTSVSVAGISTSFATPFSATSKSQSVEWYSKTVYGQKFLRLRAVTIPAGVLTA